MLQRLLILLIVFLAGGNISAQTDIDYTPLANRLADYGQLTMAWDIDGLLSMTVPELFEFVPQEVLRQQMEGLLSDENMKVTFHNFTIDQIGEAISEHERAYVPVECHHNITFKLLSPAYREDEFTSRMIRMLEKSYPRVNFDPKNHAIEVVVDKSMFAIRASAKEEWYFVEYRPENAALMDLLVPPSVREQLK